jgi:outer membrane receptor protein involved in Fe transport
MNSELRTGLIFDTDLSERRFAGFSQDHWTQSPSLTLDYGVRYEYNRLPFTLPQDALNFSPRFGVAWTPRKFTGKPSEWPMNLWASLRCF